MREGESGGACLLLSVSTNPLPCSQSWCAGPRSTEGSAEHAGQFKNSSTSTPKGPSSHPWVSLYLINTVLLHHHPLLTMTTSGCPVEQWRLRKRRSTGATHQGQNIFVCVCVSANSVLKLTLIKIERDLLFKHSIK